MRKKILVVGGVAGGASVAARVRRVDEEAKIVIFEKGPHVSFSNCSLPYFLSGTVANSASLIMMSPEKFRKSHDIDVQVNSEVVSIDRRRKAIVVKNTITGETLTEAYDVLVLAPGAAPTRPKGVEGASLPHVFTIRNVIDVVNLKRYLDAGGIQDVAVIGGGLIGVEVAENLRELGKHVTLVEATNQILAPFDFDMAQILQKEMLDHGVDVIVDDGVEKITPESIVLVSGKEVRAGAVILAIGIAPETDLARAADLEIGETGGIKVDRNYRTNDKSIYAVGDAIQTFNRLTHRPSRLALAGPAQRQARAAADAIYGIQHNHNGVIGSCAIRVFGLNAAATGLSERMAVAAGIPFDFVYVIPADKVVLMPGSASVHFKLIFETPTGRILGAQAIGEGNIDKRIDVIAAMIAMNGTVEHLKELELCYSPVFGTAKDVVNQAALVALNIIYGRFRQVPVTTVRKLVEEGACIVDVREKNEYEKGNITGSVNIPLSELRRRVNEIPREQAVYLYCRSGQRSYNAIMALQGRGFNNLYNISGSFLGLSFYEYYADLTRGRKKIVTAYCFD